MKVCKRIILTFLLYGFETYFITLVEELKLEAFEN